MTRTGIVKGLLCSAGFLAITVADRLLKVWCVENIMEGPDVPLVNGVVSLTYAENRGAAFGMLEDGRWFFVALGIVVSFAVLWLIAKNKQYGDNAVCVTAMVMMLAGTMGNLLDRLFHGYVVDMFRLEFINFAIFNIADIALTCGGALFCLYLLLVDAKKDAK